MRIAKLLLPILLLAAPLIAQRHAAPATAPMNAQQALAAYLARVQQVEGATTTTVGSLWTEGGRYANLSSDYKARNVNDLITVHVLEATQATGSSISMQPAK